MKIPGWARAAIITLAAAVVLLASTLLAVSAPAQWYLSPGTLRDNHAGEKISCAKCHEAFLGAPDSKCEKCHKDIARNRTQRHGRHAGMIGACGNCHPMHARRGQPDIFVDPDSVDHTLMRFALAKHERQACPDCHGADFTRFNKKAGRRCSKCHLDLALPENNRLAGLGIAWAISPEAQEFPEHLKAVGDDCLKCHRGGGRVKYKHKGSLKFFTGKHASAKCLGCHKNQKYTIKADKCEGCHKRGHGRELKSGCDRCHDLKGWKPASPEHAGKLAPDHQKLKCAKCHKDKKYTGLNWACSTCHESTHPDAFGDQCGQCHYQEHWKPAKMNHDIVSTLCGGCHKSSHRSGYSDNCSICHNRSNWKSASMNHAGVTIDCSGCHKPPGGHYSGSCNRCHSSRAWKPASAGGHGVNLSGRHTALGCNSCHRGGRYSGLSWNCASCHSNPHSGYSASCGSCHSQSGWRPASFKHSAVSGDCSACHQAPGGHYSGSCSQCHKSPGSWSASFGDHSKVGEHTSRSFSCSTCHPSGYTSYSCLGCHSSNSPDDDEDDDD